MLKKLKALVLSLFVIAFILLFYTLTYGLDIDLYTVTGQQLPPNVLIILDNSSSMLTEDQPLDFNPNSPDSPYPGPYLTNGVYRKQGSDWVLFTDSVNNIVCTDAKDMLTIYGIYNGKINNSDFECTGNTMFLQTGNYMNYLGWTTTSNQPRLGLAKGTIHSYVNATPGVNFGLMVFNANGQGGEVVAPVSGDKNPLFNALTAIQPPTVVDWTPLAETLYEAMLHFRGGPSYYNQDINYGNSVIQYWCQKNYVILITDGAPTYDVQDDPSSPITNQIGTFPKIGDYDNDGKDPGNYTEFGSHYLDDVAKYIHESDVSSILKGRQNITFFTIGFNPSQFAIDSTLLQSAAMEGGGKFFYCHNAQSFKIAFQLIIEEVLSKSTSFVAPTVPISQMEKMSSSNRIYLAMFEPTERSFWKGNVKKFGIAESNDPAKGIVAGDILDKNGNPAIDPQLNAIYDTALSYWSTVEDGGEVEKGGVGKIVWDMPDLFQRKICTYLGGPNKYLKDPSNAFTTTNISAALLNLPNDDEKNKLVNFVYGYDSYDQNGNGVIDEKRDWILGGFIHSRPLIVPYPSGTVIFVGGNDGMLHAFDENSGAELWAFIPRDLLPKLKNLSGDTVEFFVDGSPKIYIETDPDGTITKAILICGERRGGDHYFALNVKDPLNPQWMWEIHPALADYAEMGQTWSSPLLGKIKRETNDQWVFFIGGGYDTNQDNLPVTGNDTKGRAIYVGDVLTGERIWEYSYADNGLMKYSIPSDITRVDTNGDGRIDRLYVGDMGGQIWRFNIEDPSPSNWTGKCIFNSNEPPPVSGDRRKIFYPPDVSLELDWAEYELLLFGTGDREHPKNKGITDRLYTLKDRNPGAVLNDNNLVDVTEGLLQSSSTSDTDKKTILDDLKAKSGWYISLDPNSGEKCISPALIFFKISYFSTFIPCTEITTDPCYLGEGLARLYALNYLNGNSVFNFDLTNGEILTKDDRSMLIGTAIPSGTIIAIIGGTTTTGYIGIGGGIFKAPLKSSKVLIPVNWRQKF
jgi:type IV pilus assembly protein PilY1